MGHTWRIRYKDVVVRQKSVPEIGVRDGFKALEFARGDEVQTAIGRHQN
jgi:hypothetical protein